MVSFKVKDDIYWVGARDWNLRWFHGPAYSTHHGTTYNSYLIRDEKNVLVDGVFKPFTLRFFEHLLEVINFEEIDYYVINHIEPDHSSSFPETMDKLRDDVIIICTEKGKEGLIEHYGNGYNFQTVKTGDKINIGRRNLNFINAAMLHWPDSMFTYIPEEKLLLPNDAFGMHLCVSGLFDDLLEEAMLVQEAKKYFANILTPFSGILSKKIKEIQELQLDIEMIAPSHGIIWRKHPEKIIKQYAAWAEGIVREKVIIIYETMWDSTELMVKKIADGIMSENVEVQLYRKSISDKNDIIREILDAGALVVGSPTINNVMIPELTPLLEDLEGLKFRNKLAAVFGSYGWAGGAVDRISDRLNKAGFKLIEDPLEVVYVPDSTKLEESFQFGKRIACQVKRHVTG